jgi:hypothetical protein
MVGARVKKLASVMAALSVVLVGCGSSNSSSNPAQPSGANPPLTGAPTSTGPANSPQTGAPTSTGPAATPGAPGSSGPAETPGVPAPGVPVALEQVVYFLVTDSSGTKPTEGTNVMLLFEPGGRAILYATSPADALSHHGTWTYNSGSLALTFTAVDFAPEATFALGLTDDTVSMPFQVFSMDAGTSTWRRGALSIVSMAQAIFGAAVADPDIVNPRADEAVDEAYRAVKALADSGYALRDDIATDGIATSGGPGVTLAAWHLPGPTPRAENAPGPKIKSVTRVANGVSIEFEGAPTVSVPLYNWAADPASPAPLVTGPIAADPRVRLDSGSPHNGASDPREKTAVLISPFQTGRFYGNVWANLVPDRAATWLSLNVGSHAPSRGFDWTGIQAKLVKHGYSVKPVMNEAATLVGIIEGLRTVSGRAPGFVIVNTHGMADGSLATGVDLGQVGDDEAVAGAWWATLATLRPAGVSDLLTFEGGTPDNPKTIGRMALPRDEAVGVSDYFLSLKPAFWRWLAGRGASLDRSLVYMAVCLTDATPALREAIHAKAYFAWNEPVNPYLAGSVASYLVDDLARPTHNAEEAFYNIFRVVATRSTIYDYDRVFGQAIPGAINKGTPFLDFFRGWGWDGATLIPYGTSGWLDRTMNPGSVWWMVFVARWDNVAAAGAAKLVDCYNTYWKDGRPGGIADEFCNSANPGGTPTADEVGYATYLLTGTQLMPYSRTVVPRFTLNDGA